MTTSAEAAPIPTATTRWGRLPEHLRVLFIAGCQRTGSWLAEAFAADSAVAVLLEEAASAAEGAARLREEAFDAVLVSHEPEALDALELVEGLRAGGCDEPIIVLGADDEHDLGPLCYEVGADAYLCAPTATTRSLIWAVARAVDRHHLTRENRRLAQAERHRLRLDHDEAQRVLDDQRALVHDLESLCGTNPATEPDLTPTDDTPGALSLPAQLIEHYRELLRTYVIMGSGNLATDMSDLAELLASVGITARQTMQLHLLVLEELVRGLGTRSSRHVMTRADLLVLDVMMHLGESYRVRYLEAIRPARQLALPGFDGQEPA